jgi:hypothetical protein
MSVDVMMLLLVVYLDICLDRIFLVPLRQFRLEIFITPEMFMVSQAVIPVV